MDATCRNELRELHELNCAGFDATLEQRLAEVHTEFHREIGPAKVQLIQWNFAFPVPVTLGVIGLYFRG